MADIDLRVSLGSITLNTPVLVAAGTFGYGLEFANVVPLNRLGALITKTLTRQPRAGNPPPRLVETPSGMLNAVGLQNIGLEAFLTDKLPQLVRLRVPVIVSVLGESTDELGAMIRLLDRAEGVCAIELNLSCPNIRHHSRLEAQGSRPADLQPLRPDFHQSRGGPVSLPAPQPHHSIASRQAGSLPGPTSIRAGAGQPLMIAQDPEATFAMVEEARKQTNKPLIAKLSPDVTDLAPIAQAAERAGAAALSLVNTFVGMSIDPRTRRSRVGMMTGGLSGPAIRPLAVYRVWYTAKIVHLPIIGLGGIMRAEDALEFFLAGASAVAVGTANFTDPRAALKILCGLERYLQREKMQSLRDLQGAINRTEVAAQRVERP